MDAPAVRAVRLLARTCAVRAAGTNGQVSQWGALQAGAPPRTR